MIFSYYIQCCVKSKVFCFFVFFFTRFKSPKMGKGNPSKYKVQFLNAKKKFKGGKNYPNLPGLLITVNSLFNFGS